MARDVHHRGRPGHHLGLRLPQSGATSPRDAAWLDPAEGEAVEPRSPPSRPGSAGRATAGRCAPATSCCFAPVLPVEPRHLRLRLLAAVDRQGRLRPGHRAHRPDLRRSRTSSRSSLMIVNSRGVGPHRQPLAFVWPWLLLGAARVLRLLPARPEPLLAVVPAAGRRRRAPCTPRTARTSPTSRSSCPADAAALDRADQLLRRARRLRRQLPVGWLNDSTGSTDASFLLMAACLACRRPRSCPSWPATNRARVRPRRPAGGLMLRIARILHGAAAPSPTRSSRRDEPRPSLRRPDARLRRRSPPSAIAARRGPLLAPGRSPGRRRDGAQHRRGRPPAPAAGVPQASASVVGPGALDPAARRQSGGWTPRASSPSSSGRRPGT